jgi:hypothetical protein
MCDASKKGNNFMSAKSNALGILFLVVLMGVCFAAAEYCYNSGYDQGYNAGYVSARSKGLEETQAWKKECLNQISRANYWIQSYREGAAKAAEYRKAYIELAIGQSRDGYGPMVQGSLGEGQKEIEQFGSPTNLFGFPDSGSARRRTEEPKKHKYDL